MTLADDLLLIAIGPRDGRIRVVERIGIALLALELVELTLSKRITVDEHRIAVIDPSPAGHPRLDRALASLHGSGGSVLGAWLEQRPPEPGIIRQYMTLLTDQGVIQAEHREQGASVSTRIVLLDHERCARARARVDPIAHGGQPATAADQALACVVHACGLDRYLYRGVRGIPARSRLARLTGHPQIIRATIDAADAAFADAVTQALSEGIAKLTVALTRVMRYAYQIEQAQHAASHSASSSGHHAAHAGGGGHH
jgi:hypothetical protein